MIQIDNKIISLEVFSRHFLCNLHKCKGACCIHGDSGAPLSDQEVDLLIEEMPLIEAYMRPEGIEAVKEQGIPVIDLEGDKVTALINGEECAYVIFEKGIAFCAIEKAWMEKKISFRKPISCHLYPIRIKEFDDFEALNYDRWDICKPAREMGQRNALPVFRFLKDALIRKYGEDFYKEMENVYDELKEQKLI